MTGDTGSLEIIILDYSCYMPMFLLLSSMDSVKLIPIKYPYQN